MYKSSDMKYINADSMVEQKQSQNTNKPVSNKSQSMLQSGSLFYTESLNHKKACCLIMIHDRHQLTCRKLVQFSVSTLDYQDDKAKIEKWTR